METKMIASDFEKWLKWITMEALNQLTFIKYYRNILKLQ